MSKIAGHKVQLALAVLKGRREEVKKLLSFTSPEEAKARLEQLDAEIETFENNLKKAGVIKND